MVVRSFQSVELEDHQAVDEHLLVFVAAVAAHSLQDLLIPAARTLHVGDAEERLRSRRHWSSVNDQQA